jgi:hypothetical protein
MLVFLCNCNTSISTEEYAAYEKRVKIAEQAVSKWIKDNAQYPDSYESLSFTDYQESYTLDGNERVPDSDNYVIYHSHRILNKDSVMKTFSGYFLMEYDYFVSIIELERSNSVSGGSEPRTQVWLNDFGRAYTKEDSLLIEKRSDREVKKIMKELKDGLESGDMETDNPEEAKKLLKFLDSAVDKKE